VIDIKPNRSITAVLAFMDDFQEAIFSVNSLFSSSP